MELDIYLHDFVNRTASLATVVRKLVMDQARPLLLVSGVSGIGKSYLLRECVSQCDARQVAVAHISLDEERNKHYLSILDRLREDLGPDGFAPLLQAMEQIRAENRAALERFFSPDRDDTSTDSVALKAGNIGEDAQVAVGRNIVQIRTDVLNLWQYEDDLVKRHIQMQLADAIYHCLKSLTEGCIAVIFIDHWEAADQQVQEWLKSTLLQWSVNRKLPNVMTVVSGVAQPDILLRPLRMEQMVLTELSKEDFHSYWVGKRGLPEEMLESEFVKCKGLPLTMRLRADMQERRQRSA